MKTIYLASFLEPENHGSGRKISIANRKPDSIEVAGAFEHFIPSNEISDTYRKKQLDSQVEASDYFQSAFKSQLDDFFKNVNNNDDLPFEDGDTLLSWERQGNTSYRTMVAKYLKDIGYDVVLK